MLDVMKKKSAVGGGLAVLLGSACGTAAAQDAPSSSEPVEFREYVDKSKMVSGDGIVGVGFSASALPPSDGFNTILIHTDGPRPNRISLEVKTVDGRYEAYPSQEITLKPCGASHSVSCQWTKVDFTGASRRMLGEYDAGHYTVKAFDKPTGRVFPAYFASWNAIKAKSWEQTGEVDFFINSENSTVFFRDQRPGANGRSNCPKVVSKHRSSINYDTICSVSIRQVLNSDEIMFYRSQGSIMLDPIIARLK
mgnify:CR=1 FL=1